MLSLAAVPADGCTGLAGHNIEGLKISTSYGVSSDPMMPFCPTTSNGNFLTFMYFEHDINLVVSFSDNVYLLILYS